MKQLCDKSKLKGQMPCSKLSLALSDCSFNLKQINPSFGLTDNLGCFGLFSDMTAHYTSRPSLPTPVAHSHLSGWLTRLASTDVHPMSFPSSFPCRSISSPPSFPVLLPSPPPSSS
eukprot:750406-Hanusia_phi.AAC.4